MASILDDGVRNVTDALKREGMWESTLLIFVSDNGGPTNGNEGTASNNFPMRGGKNTLWEGGTRVLAVARGAGVGAALRGTVSHAPVNPTPTPYPYPYPYPEPGEPRACARGRLAEDFAPLRDRRPGACPPLPPWHTQPVVPPLSPSPALLVLPCLSTSAHASALPPCSRWCRPPPSQHTWMATASMSSRR